MSYHCLLTFSVSDKKSIVILVSIPLCVIDLFSLTTFKIFSLSLMFRKLLTGVPVCIYCVSPAWGLLSVIG